jgi:hypothetical protein
MKSSPNSTSTSTSASTSRRIAAADAAGASTSALVLVLVPVPVPVPVLVLVVLSLPPTLLGLVPALVLALVVLSLPPMLLGLVPSASTSTSRRNALTVPPNWPAVIERLKRHPTEAAIKDSFRNCNMTPMDVNHNNHDATWFGAHEKFPSLLALTNENRTIDKGNIKRFYRGISGHCYQT